MFYSIFTPIGHISHFVVFLPDFACVCPYRSATVLAWSQTTLQVKFKISVLFPLETMQIINHGEDAILQLENVLIQQLNI